MDDQHFDLNSPTRTFNKRKNLSEDMSDQSLEFISPTKVHLSSEKWHKSMKVEKQIPIAESFFSLIKKDKDRINSKSLSFDHSCNTILESQLASPKEYIGSSLKAKTVMNKENSIDPVSKRHKTSNCSSIRTSQDNLNITKYPKSGENNGRDYMDPISLTSDSSLKTVHDKQKISHSEYLDENDNRDNFSTESSMSASQNRRYSNSDEIDKTDSMTNALPTSAAASGNHDFASTQESEENSDQELPYECVYCNKNFAHSHALDYHVRIHRQPFICKYCKKEYHIAAAFISHFEKHTGGRGKPFICHICNKGYLKKKNFIKHLKIHLNNPNK